LLNRLSLEVYGVQYLDQDHDAPSSNAGGTFALRSFGARACYEVAPGALSFAGCGALSDNHIAARGYGVTQPGSAATDIGALWLGARFQLALGRHAALVLDVGPDYIFGGANFVLTRIGAVYKVTRFDAAGSLKLAWRF
jgi:hypothetical protein